MISFIIPAHDEERLIGETLDALQICIRALAMRCEIIVVDDASTDRTAEIAGERGVRVVGVTHRHIAAARNAGAREASGEMLMFVDADTLVGVDVIRAAHRALLDGALGGGCGVRLQGPLGRRLKIAESFFVWFFRVTRVAPGCFLFCTRPAFDAVGGFDETWYAGEDVAMSRALARRGRFVILREAVMTSARKVQTFSAIEHLRLIVRLAWRGRRLLKSREGLELWYGRRR